MVIRVVAKDGKIIPIHSSAAFQEALHVRYLSSLKFSSAKLQKKVEAKCRVAHFRQWITARQKWLGQYYAKEIGGAATLDLSIAWIDDTLQYGVWTNREIAPKAFVGEYTGLLRRRALWRRWKNRYCFDYTIGPQRSTSLVIDCRDCGNHTRFINHSFTPNLDLISIYLDGIIRVILIAKERIAAGTQLSYDYGSDYWEKRGDPVEISS